MSAHDEAVYSFPTVFRVASSRRRMELMTSMAISTFAMLDRSQRAVIAMDLKRLRANAKPDSNISITSVAAVASPPAKVWDDGMDDIMSHLSTLPGPND